MNIRKYNLINGLPTLGDYVFIWTGEVVSQETATNQDGTLKTGYGEDGDFQGVEKVYPSGNKTVWLTCQTTIESVATSYVLQFNYNVDTQIWSRIENVEYFDSNKMVADASVYVSLADGSIVDYATSHNEDGTFKAGFNTQIYGFKFSTGLEVYNNILTGMLRRIPA
jgi:hypothetical protein